MMPLVLIVVVAAATLTSTPTSAVRNVVLPLGCNKEYIRQMLLSHCDRYRRGQRSAPSVAEGGEGAQQQVELESSWGQGVEGMENPSLPLSRRRLFLETPDGVVPPEVLALAESEGDLERFARAEKALFKCCFKGCSWKDFVGVC
ncbi:uncharacterized protein LOC124162232 [Ischnura elegans]|uniref:uncharacterized protein LOC124162232 n=1 Tax=Ischnura elegans TaxID=197161 RepID=UPI001ED8756F|nr:uncharacterized protein LOC124162232 [Ischnura elegans]